MKEVWPRRFSLTANVPEMFKAKPHERVASVLRFQASST